MNPACRRLLLLCLSICMAAEPAFALTLTWDANGTGAGQTDGLGTWLTANQWRNGASNVTWTNGSDAFIGSTGVGDVITLGAVTAGLVEFGPFTGTYTLSGGSLGLATGLKMNPTSGSAVISTPIALSASQTWTSNATNALTVSGITSGGFGITKEGTGVVAMSGANTFTGNVVLNAGTLRVTSNNVGTLGTGAAALFVNGGILDFQGSGSIVLGRNATVSANATMIPSRSIAGSGLTYTLGTLTIGSQTLDVPGGTNITGGTAAVTFSGSTTLTGTPTFNVKNPIYGGVTQLSIGAIGAGAQGIIKNGDGVLLLSAANAYTGDTRINAGTLRFGNAGFAAPNRSVKVAEGATVGLNSSANNAFLNRLEENSNAFVVALGSITNSSALDFSSSTGARLPNASLGALASSTISPVFSGPLTPFGNVYRLGGGGGMLTVQSTLSGTGNLLVIRGPGIVFLNQTGVGSNTYDDGTYLEPGAALQVARTGANQDLGGAGRSVVMADGATLMTTTTAAIDNSFLQRVVESPRVISIYMQQVSSNPLDFSGGAGGNLPNAILGGNVTYSGTITPNNSTYRLGGGVYTGSGGDELTLAGAALVGSNSVVVSSLFSAPAASAHRVVLTGANTYTGTTTIDRQALRLDTSTGTIANSRGIEIYNGGQLLLNNASTTTNNTNRLNNTAPLTVKAGGSLTFTSSADGADYTETMGALTVRSGMFQYNANSFFSTGKLYQFTFGGLSMPGTGTVAFNGTSSLGSAATGNPTVTISGQPDLGGSSGDWIGPQFVATRAVAAFAGYGPNGVAALTGTPTATSVLQNLTTTSTDATKIYRVTGNTSLMLSAGPTTRTWKGFTYQGGSQSPLSPLQTIDLNGNTVKLVGGGLAVASGTVAIANGTLTSGNATSVPLYIHVQSASGTSTTISAAIVDNPGGGSLTLIKSNNASAAGILFLNGANTYTGDTIVNAGTLELANPNLANGADVRLFSAGTLQLDFAGSDTVRRLYIDDQQQAAGTWGAPYSGADYTTPLITGSGLLTVTQGPPASLPPGFTSWITSFGLTGADAAPANDYDRDGLPNAVEYILGTSPLVASGGGPVASMSGGNFVFTFARAVGLKTPDTQTDIDVGLTPGAWTQAFHVGNDTASSTPGVTVTPGPSPAVEFVTLTIPLGQDEHKFACLRVTITP